MDDKNELEKIKEKYQARNKYINNYIKNNYDRVVLLLNKGQKAAIEKKARLNGFKSCNDYLKAVIDKELNQDGQKSPEPLNEITTDPQQDHGQN